MSTLSFQRRAAWKAAGSVAETLDIDEIGAEPLAHLARSIDASGALLYRFDEHGMVGGRGGSLSAALPAYCADLFFEDPLQQSLLQLERTPLVVIVSALDGFDQRRFMRSAAYCDFYERHGMNHLVGCGLTPTRYGSSGMTGILFTRARSQTPFSDDNIALLREVLPGFQAAVRRSDRLARERPAQRALSAQDAHSSSEARARAAALLGSRRGLTAAEIEVLTLIAAGLPNREIAAKRFVSLETIRTHVRRILGKLAVPTRTQAAVLVHNTRAL